MASQIYSRYVPPPKKGPILTAEAQGSAARVPAVQPELSIATPPATRHDASSTYIRYVPPPKTKIQPTSKSASEPISSPPIAKRKRDEVIDSVEGTKSSKKSRKEKSANQFAQIVPRNEPEQAQVITGANVLAQDGEDVTQGSEEGVQTVELIREPGLSSKEGKKKKKQMKHNTLRPFEDAVDQLTEDAPQADQDGLAHVVKSRKKQKMRDNQLENIADDKYGRNVGAEDQDEDEEGDSRHEKLMKKRRKSLKKAEKLAKTAVEGPTSDTVGEILIEPPTEVHDLVPLPQPDPVAELPSVPTAASLPPWLASPIRVSPSATAQFEDLGISEHVAKVLRQKGFSEAFAVQAAVLPLLLPGQSQQPGDVLVSAATGSGKTLSYVLPMIEDISRCGRHSLGIQGLIIMPTRELVTQARQVSDICASIFGRAEGYHNKVRIGTAVGNEALKTEQSSLIEQDYTCNREKYEEILTRDNAGWLDTQIGTSEENRLFSGKSAVSTLYGDISSVSTRVDILICTPGRLVEHLKSTAGFSLANLRWLVVDEADKLLDQSFQQWLDTVIAALTANKLSSQSRQVRKVVLSATMTRDVGQLNQLKLFRPKLVVLEGSSHVEDDSTDERVHSEAHVLPPLLVESGVKVDEEAVKPLYLMEVLRRANIVSETAPKEGSSPSDFDSDTSSEMSSTHSNPKVIHTVISQQSTAQDFPRGVLIFAKSNETAVRLGRLIALLSPVLSSKIGTLTSTTPRASRQRTITSFSSGRISILVASDLVSRGLDLPNLAHVINYDIPTSLTSYVHRVGRAARAGKKGHAWTLFTSAEARWFWHEIGRSANIERASGSKVERVNIKQDLFDGEKLKYEDALEELGKAASSSRVGKV